MKLLKKAFYHLANSLFLSLVHRGVYKQVVIYDIDNTLAHTWPSLVDQGRADYGSLPYFEDVLTEIVNNNAKEDMLVLFCTVRPIGKYFVTYRWLRRIGLDISIPQLFFSNSPLDKLALIRKAKIKYGQITVVDDLSYGHEHGVTKFYDDAIRELKSLGVKYRGYDDLKRLQKQVKHLHG
jgi:hypothetical protein